jgi:ABC-2 type transport system ATP-binding protein
MRQRLHVARGLLHDPPREQAQVLVVQVDDRREVTLALLGRLDGASVGRVSSREPTLEDAYVALVTEE